MKLKVLPPTLRKNNRYLALDIKIKENISKDDLVNIVWNGCIRFFGENGTANFNLWVMKFYEIEKTNDYNHYQAILRCQRDYVDNVRSSIALIYKYNRKSISISTIGLSGTIKGCQKFIDG
ncbi:Rpp14/Pop5 family protein [uncultured Methanobrevibacter sp.]|uniref:Rpp14/Pop5 family protein n=1 Tax=uncultured Methanobrevibacter sp. TaxID=253161 RepID=UPI00260F3457|nr:Rpp14/Pop5 family protein [uncultured Methanobrevibacter sp.]